MEEKTKKRLVVVSNRLPFKLTERNGKVSLQPSDGGLVSALKSFFDRDAAQSEFTEKIWIGSADFPQKRWEKYVKQKNATDQSFVVEPIFIDSKLYTKYYNGFCNSTLWPLFHYFNTYTVFDNDQFLAYEAVNQQFAEVVAKVMKPNDTVWVHDYQLFLLPELIRKKKSKATIGFFLHIPFPSFEIFRLLHRSWKEAILKGILGADIVGFHTHEYVQHFLKTVRMVLGVDHHFRTIAIEDRIVKVDLFPLGIDYNRFHHATLNDKTVELKDSIRKNFIDKKIIFSVDRLDYTKGLTHRLNGYEKFIEMHPEWKGKVVFVLVVVPSREIISKYNERKNLLEEMVGRINGRFSTLNWQPIIYRYSHLPFDELCAMYQAADVALITPLRDGMNLVAKEYIASRVAQRGVLILSELAGAASELGEAILVNPMDTFELANAIQQALTMPLTEQRQRMAHLQKRLTTYDVFRWVEDFIAQLNDVKKLQASRELHFVSDQERNEIVSQYKKAKSRHLFLDYDGTLVPFARIPGEAQPDKNLLRLLELLASDSKTTITIISGRDSAVLDSWFNGLPINLVAEHGASIRRKNSTWKSERSIDQSWKPNIFPVFELFVQRCPGSFIEEKSHTIAWHYRNVEKELGFIRSRELLDALMHLIRQAQLQVIDGNKVIEVRVAGVDKGVAATKLLLEQPASFTMVIGDDKTDEDMFHALRDKAKTIKVGPGMTEAEFALPSQKEVITLLKGLV